MKLVLSVEASADLDGIYEYIAKDLANPDAARRVVQRITKHTSKLRDFPRAGKLLTDISEQLEGYRLTVIDHYLVIYRYDKDAVSVLRIVHASLDYTRLL